MLEIFKKLRVSKIRIFKKIKISKKLTGFFLQVGKFCANRQKIRRVWKAHCGLGPKNYSSLANDFIMRSCGLLKKWKIAGVDYSAF